MDVCHFLCISLPRLCIMISSGYSFYYHVWQYEFVSFWKSVILHLLPQSYLWLYRNNYRAIIGLFLERKCYCYRMVFDTDTVIYLCFLNWNCELKTWFFSFEIMSSTHDFSSKKCVIMCVTVFILLHISSPSSFSNPIS